MRKGTTIETTAATIATTSVTVNQTLSSIVVSPASAALNESQTQQFSATGLDQGGNPLITQPSFSWSVNGGGSIDSAGLFTAGAAVGGPFTVIAASGPIDAVASAVADAIGVHIHELPLTPERVLAAVLAYDVVIDLSLLRR